MAYQNCHLFKEDSKVLEIGCGNVDLIRKLVRGRRGHWYGLDPNPSSIASHVGSVKKIPFDDNYFDVVFSSQSIEHWYQSTTTFDEGLGEIHRVLKTGGIFLIDFPIFLHGHYIFMLGKENIINRLFTSPSWIIEKNEDWRKNPAPLAPYYTWNGKRTKYVDEWICQQLLKREFKSAYLKSLLLRKHNAVYDNIESDCKQNGDKLVFKILNFYKRSRRYITRKIS
jgi:ubiquinone/menaquinone biosynthesis C-methylase UbiE